MMRHRMASRLFARSRRRDRGSAYILALLVILVLTFLGLTLSLVTTTEMQLGSNDRVLQRAFYAGDTGINYATARLLVTKETSAILLPVTERVTTGTDRTPSAATRVQLAAVIPVLSGPAAYSEINNVGTYSSKAANRSVVSIAAAGQRTLQGSTGPVASRTVSALIDLQPFELPIKAYDPLEDPSISGRTLVCPPPSYSCN